MDIFFGRTAFATTVGHETAKTRAWFPPHWQAFLKAAEQVSVPDYVEKKGSGQLAGLFQQAMDGYAGRGGMIGRHRLKAYGFLDLSFKAGRSKHAGRLRRRLRRSAVGSHGRPARVCSQRSATAATRRLVTSSASSGWRRSPATGAAPVRRVVLDTRGTGLRYQAGRSLRHPARERRRVGRQDARRASSAHGDEPIALTTEWRAARAAPRRLSRRAGALAADAAHLRPHSPGVTDAAAKTSCSRSRTTKSLASDSRGARRGPVGALGSPCKCWRRADSIPKRLRKVEPGEREHIARLVPPEAFRMYSISSVMDGAQADEIHLTIGQLSYETTTTDVSRVRHTRWHLYRFSRQDD